MIPPESEEPIAKLKKKFPTVDGGPLFNGLRTLREMGRDQQLLHPDIVPFLAPSLLIGTYEEAEGNLGRVRSPPWMAATPPSVLRFGSSTSAANAAQLVAASPGTGKMWIVLRIMVTASAGTPTIVVDVRDQATALRTLRLLNDTAAEIYWPNNSAQASTAGSPQPVSPWGLLICNNNSGSLLFNIGAAGAGNTSTVRLVVLEYDEASWIVASGSAITIASES